MKRMTIIVICLFLTGMLGLHGCGSPSPGYDSKEHTDSLQDNEAEEMLVYESSMELQYAENFSVDYYKGGKHGRRYHSIAASREEAVSGCVRCYGYVS